MAIQKTSSQAQLQTTATNLFDVINTSGVDLGNVTFTNVHPSTTILAFCSIVPTGSNMTSGNAIIWNLPIGPSGLLSVSQPMFMPSGSKFQASGSSAGLNAYVSYLKLN